MNTHPLRVLFVSHGSACRSIIAATMLIQLSGGRGRYEAFTADIHPLSSAYEYDDDVFTLFGMPPASVEAIKKNPRRVRSIKQWEVPVHMVVCMHPIAPDVIAHCNPILRGQTNWQFWEVPDPRGKGIAAYEATKTNLAGKLGILIGSTN